MMRALHGLELTPPVRADYKGRTRDLGPRVWHALSLLRDWRGRMPADELTRVVMRRPGVARRTLASLCHRANRQLAAMGCPIRLSVEGEHVTVN